MDKKIKDYLGIGGVILMAAFSIAILWHARSYSLVIEPASFRSFTVSGEGRSISIPDVAKFSFSVLTQGGKDLGSLQKENTLKMNRAIGVLKAAGVEEKDIKTQQYSLEPRYQYFSCRNGNLNENNQPCPPPEIVGYTVQQSIDVKVRNFEKVGQLLSEVVQSGANSVSQLSFTIDNPTEVQNKARAEAIAKAKKKAEAIAEAGGFRLGRLISIEENNFSEPRPVFAYGVGTVESKAIAPSIQPGSQEIKINVALKYEIR